MEAEALERTQEASRRAHCSPEIQLASITDYSYFYSKFPGHLRCLPLLQGALLSEEEQPQTLRERVKEITEIKMDLDAKLPCGLSFREIHQMKKAGIDKPEFVSWAEWQGPRRLSHRHQLVAHLAALGYSQRDIARNTGFSESRISLLMQGEMMQSQIKLVREVEMNGLGVIQKLDQLSSQAIRVYEQILMDPGQRAALRAKVATDVLDRKLGKPNQRIDVGGSLIKDFITLLKQQDEDRKTMPGQSYQVENSSIDEASLVPEIPAEAFLASPISAPPVSLPQPAAPSPSKDDWFAEKLKGGNDA